MVDTRFLGLFHSLRNRTYITFVVPHRDPCLFHLIESVHPAEGVALPATSSQTDSEQVSVPLVTFEY